jgi:hypothetical protein
MDDDSEFLEFLKAIAEEAALDRARFRIAAARAEKQLQGHRGRGLQAEIEHTMIGLLIEAKLEATGYSLTKTVPDAAVEFGVSERTAWTAWGQSATALNRRLTASRPPATGSCSATMRFPDLSPDRVDEPVECGSRGFADSAYQKTRRTALAVAELLIEKKRARPKPSLPRVLWLERPMLPD